MADLYLVPRIHIIVYRILITLPPDPVRPLPFPSRPVLPESPFVTNEVLPFLSVVVTVTRN